MQKLLFSEIIRAEKHSEQTRKYHCIGGGKGGDAESSVQVLVL